jgi:hypothetical protein
LTDDEIEGTGLNTQHKGKSRYHLEDQPGAGTNFGSLSRSLPKWARTGTEAKRGLYVEGKDNQGSMDLCPVYIWKA